MVVNNERLTLQDLPKPPDDKKGWPWTKESELCFKKNQQDSIFPKISIVTPSYNQGQYLEETIRSVLLQGCPNLEYIIIDGGSTDNSIEIIKKYAPYLSYWVSEPDQGQSHAINKGFAKSTGDYIAWMNSDDCYMQNALRDIFINSQGASYDFIHGGTYVGEKLNNRKIIQAKRTKIFAVKYLLRFFWNVEYIIPSQSAFVSRQLFNKVGYLDEDLHFCMDFEWFVRMALENPTAYYCQQPICFYRVYQHTKTATSQDQVHAEAVKIAKQYSDHLTFDEQKILFKLIECSDMLEEFRAYRHKPPLKTLFRHIFEVPTEVLGNRRFLGVLRRTLLGGT